MTRALLMLWMALIGAERLDLAGGGVPVTVTPFLLLTPLVVVWLVVHRHRVSARLQLTRGTIAYLLLSAAFLVSIGASVFGSLDADVTVSRGALAATHIAGTLTVAVLGHDREEVLQALRTGATIGIVLFAVLDVLAVLSFLGWLPQSVLIGPALLRLDSYGYAGIIPRLSGTTIDPNAGGLILVMFTLMTPRLRMLAVTLLLLTLSRSALAAGAVVAAVAVWERGPIAQAVPIRKMLVFVVLAIAGLLAVGESANTLDTATRALAPFAERVGLGETGSAADHGALVVRAADEGTKSLQRATLGLGWGASFVVLQDFFPGNRYGNFHSLYGTVFAELGVIALFTMLVMLGGGLARKTPWRAAVAGFIVFNLFYQSTTVPVFWLLLALAWVSPKNPAFSHGDATG